VGKVKVELWRAFLCTRKKVAEHGNQSSTFTFPTQHPDNEGARRRNQIAGPGSPVFARSMPGADPSVRL
jgi:hypothetical protein